MREVFEQPGMRAAASSCDPIALELGESRTTGPIAAKSKFISSIHFEQPVAPKANKPHCAPPLEAFPQELLLVTSISIHS